jgi:hypothetical protein
LCCSGGPFCAGICGGLGGMPGGPGGIPRVMGICRGSMLGGGGFIDMGCCGGPLLKGGGWFGGGASMGPPLFCIGMLFIGGRWGG